MVFSPFFSRPNDLTRFVTFTSAAPELEFNRWFHPSGVPCEVSLATFILVDHDHAPVMSASPSVDLAADPTIHRGAYSLRLGFFQASRGSVAHARPPTDSGF